MVISYADFLIRDWQPGDRHSAANVIRAVLTEYGLPWQPDGADRDVIAVEEYYLQTGGTFWVIDHQGTLVGTSGYYPIQREANAVEIRKMYLLPTARRQGLGAFLLQHLETAIANQGFTAIWIETASILKEAVQLYESRGYCAATGVETDRCDRVYVKQLTPSANVPNRR
ncbi:MAG: GNAT family N-acetyltransferase [Synechocystis sp.]|nr:GNAT family N-acetyltransferase [Synechocystis sp.]